MVLLRYTKKTAEIVLHVTNGVRAFALREEIGFYERVEGGERLVVLLKSAVLWISTL
jgi:hypothetical protein